MLGIKWATITNMGSIAFGAFLMTLIKILRALAESAQGGENGAAAIIMCCISCCLFCIQ